jgi:hypothetical protein
MKRTPNQPVRAAVVTAALATIEMLVLGLLAPSAALAGGGWSAPSRIDGTQAFASISCPSASFCLTVNTAGSAFAYNGRSWSAPERTGATNRLTSVSCLSASFCAAVTTSGSRNDGSALVYHNGSWSSPTYFNFQVDEFDSVSCGSLSFCVAVGTNYAGSSGGAAWSYDGTSWKAMTVHDPDVYQISSVSCVSSSFCAAVDSGGNALAYVNGSWGAPKRIDGYTHLSSVSCASASFCAAVDTSGRAFAYTNGSWEKATKVDPGSLLSSVSCASASFCAAVDTGGRAFVFNGSSWSSPDAIDPDGSLTSDSCPSASFCVAVDDSGRVLTFGGAEPAKAVAAFALPHGAVHADSLVHFNAATSRVAGAQIKSFRWTLHGPGLVGGSDTVQCAGSTSQLYMSFAYAGTVQVGLQVTDASGAVTTATHTLGVGRATEVHLKTPIASQRPVPAGFQATSVPFRPTNVADCSSGPTDPQEPLTQNGGPPAKCTSQVEFDLVQAVGCLTRANFATGVTLDPFDGAVLTWDLDRSLQASQALLSYLASQGLTPPSGPSAGTTAALEAAPAHQHTGTPPVTVPPPSPNAPAKPETYASQAVEALQEQVITSPWVSDQTVRVNGLDFTPEDGHQVVFVPDFDMLIAADANVSLPMGSTEIPLEDHALVNLQMQPGSGNEAVLDTQVSQLIAQQPALSNVLKVAGFKVTGDLQFDFGTIQGQNCQAGGQYQTGVILHMALPSVFTDGKGNGLVGDLCASADNTDGLTVQDGLVEIPSAMIGDYGLSNVVFCYQGSADGFCASNLNGINFGNSGPAWYATGQGTVAGWTLDMAPPPPGNGIEFVNGNFDQAGFSLNAGNPVGGQSGLSMGPISGALGLSSIGGTFGLNPTRLSLEVGVSAVDIVQGGMAFFLVFASPNQPYTFNGNELAVGGQAATLQLPKVTVNSTAFAFGQSVGVKLGAIGNVFAQNFYALGTIPPSYLSEGFGFQVGSGCCTFGGSVTGTFNNAGQYDLHGTLNTLLDGTGLFGPAGGPYLKGSGSGDLSNVGVGACVSGAIGWGTSVPTTTLPPATTTTLPAGKSVSATGSFFYKWGQDPIDIFTKGQFNLTGCSAESNVQVDVNAASAQSAAAGLEAAGFRHAGAAYPFTLPGGLPSESLWAHGKDGAPDITVTGPSGSASSAGHELIKSGPYVILRIPGAAATYVGIQAPRAGTYTINANPGSPSITRVVRQDGLAPSVSATVSGQGSRRELHYKVGDATGLKVEFIERSAHVDHVIGITTGNKGTISFVPAPGPAGTRQIIAQLTQSGVPVVLRPGTSQPDAIVAGSYSAPGPRQLARVQSVMVHRTGRRVLVTFSPVAGATRYAVAVSLSDGTRELFVTQQRSITIQPVFFEVGGSVTVRALGDGLQTVSGPGTSGVIKALSRVVRSKALL